MLSSLALLALLATPEAAAAVPPVLPSIVAAPADPDCVSSAPIETDPCMLVESLLRGELAAAEELPLWGLGALDAINHGLQSRPTQPQQVALAEALATIGQGAVTRDVRPFLFSPDPDIAFVATWALARSSGPRAIATLEDLLRSTRPFGQRLAAIEALREIGLQSSFVALAALAADDKEDPVLRTEAARSLRRLDRPKAHKWLHSLRLKPDGNAFFAAEVQRLMAEDSLGGAQAQGVR